VLQTFTMAIEPDQPLTDVSQLQIPGTEGLWRKALLVTEDMVDRLLQVTDRGDADDLIPQEISVNPYQLALELEERQAERQRATRSDPP
jgi:hypothetical protein